MSEQVSQDGHLGVPRSVSRMPDPQLGRYKEAVFVSVLRVEGHWFTLTTMQHSERTDL